MREVYDLAGVSGKTVMGHPETKRMLADIKRGHITTLIFSKLARLARNTKELLDFSDIFRASGADMVSLQEKIDTSTPAGRLFYTMIAAMAQWEREEIGDRVKASIGIRAKLGKPLNGSSPYGYHWVDKKLTIDPTEAPIVKQTFELFLQHRRKGTVARLLNAAGHRTRNGAHWHDLTVGRILIQPAAKGTYYYNMTRRVGDWKHEEKPENQWCCINVPPAIPDELWFKVSQILEEQTKAYKKPARQPAKLFAGVTQCQCGHKMYVPSGSRKYVCMNCKKKILEDDLEAVFYGALKDNFADPTRLFQHLDAAHHNVSEKEALLASQQKEIQRVRDEMNRTHRLYLEGQIPLESFGTYHKPLEDRLRQLQEELPRLEAEVAHKKIRHLSADEILREAQEIYARWPTQSLEEKRKMVQGIVEKITVNEEEIAISFYSLPSSEELATSQQLL